MSNKAYDLRKKFAKKQQVTNEDFENLSFKEMRDLCYLLVQDLDVAYGYVERLKVEKLSLNIEK